jgi:hypothetical protein
MEGAEHTARTCWIPRTTATAAVQSTPGATSISSSEPAPSAAFMISVLVDFSAGTQLYSVCPVLAPAAIVAVKAADSRREQKQIRGTGSKKRKASRMKMHVCSCCRAGQNPQRQASPGEIFEC